MQTLSFSAALPVLLLLLLLLLCVDVHGYVMIRRKCTCGSMYGRYLKANEKGRLIDEPSADNNINTVVKNKLAEWKSLKQLGLLDRPVNFCEDVEDIIAQGQKLVAQNSQGTGTKSDSRVNYYRIHKRIKESKEKFPNGLPLARALFNTLSELSNISGDKIPDIAKSLLIDLTKVTDVRMDRQLQIQNIPAISGIEKVQVSAYKTFLRAAQGWNVPHDESVQILLSYVLLLYQRAACTAARICQVDMIQRGFLNSLSFLPGEICATVHLEEAGDPRETGAASMLASLSKCVSDYTTEMLSPLLRTLARYQRIDDLLFILSAMRNNNTTSEWSYCNANECAEILTGAMVHNVSKGVKAVSMAQLPRATKNMPPEIVFVGRSNVGKSSLVNYLLNKKALASTSAKPGHTTQFHFFYVNQQEKVEQKKQKFDGINSCSKDCSTVGKRSENCIVDSNHKEEEVSCFNVGSKAPPNFCVVDVPGMGYAEESEPADEKTNRSEKLGTRLGHQRNLGRLRNYQEDTKGRSDLIPSTIDVSEQEVNQNDRSSSWRGLLDRYLIARDPLRIVLHLIDARRGITPVDKEVLDMVWRAMNERVRVRRREFEYCAVLTKTDKLDEEAITRCIESVKKVTSKTLNRPIKALITSASDRKGGEELWRFIYPFIK